MLNFKAMYSNWFRGVIALQTESEGVHLNLALHRNMSTLAAAVSRSETPRVALHPIVLGQSTDFPLVLGSSAVELDQNISP